MRAAIGYGIGEICYNFSRPAGNVPSKVRREGKTMKFGLIVNLSKPEAVQLAQELCVWGEVRNNPFLLLGDEARVLRRPELPFERWRREVQTALVIGGDGTFLKAAHRVRDTSISLFGICIGHLGFLANGDPQHIRQEILQIEEGDFDLTRRYFLDASLKSTQGTRRIFALNDFVLSKGIPARLVSIDVSVNHKPMCQYRADGLIISTPTGSTAYALSAGGPIVPPTLDCMLLVPICAHTLYARPTLLAPSDRLICRPADGSELFITVDGDEVIPMSSHDFIEVTYSKERFINVIALPQFQYYDLLHEKLMWGWNPVTERRPRHAQ